MENKFEIGDKLRHKIHGFEGIVMAYTFYSTGCIHYALASQDLDEKGEPKDWKWYDETKLEILEKKTVEFDSYEQTTVERKGGPAPNAPQVG